MNGPAWRPQVQKLHVYEGIFNLNRAFHATLISLERLENLGFFRAEFLNACKIELEHTRANTNDELIETLREYEEGQAYRFWRMQKQWDDQLKDPDDVFLEARDRKEQIKEQIKDLQRGLDLSKPKKKRKPRSVRKRKSTQK
jgi:molecular chaperone DnaK (HSP70)